MNTKKTKFIYWLYTFAFAIFSLLLVAYAYDISKGETIAPSSTQQYKQDLLITIATVLGFKGSIALGNTGNRCLFILHHKNVKTFKQIAHEETIAIYRFY